MSILLVAPYADLVQTVHTALESSPHHVKTIVGDLQEGVQVAMEEIARGDTTVIISRGGTATLLRNSVSVPVFEINVSGYDLIRTIYPHVVAKRRIAVVGYQNVISGSRSIADILGVELGFYAVDRGDTVQSIVTAARDSGADIIIGDNVSVNAARELGLRSELVRSGPEAVRSVVDDAAQFVGHMENEMLRNRRLHMIMDHTDYAVLCLTPNDEIELMNAQAQHILQQPETRLIGRKITTDLVPEELADAILQKRTNQLVRFDDKDYVVEVSVIEALGIHSATLVFIQSSGRIKNLEGILRHHLTSRGLVAKYRFETMIARNKVVRELIEVAQRYSLTNSTILLSGETGVGKEVFAQSIHNASPRSQGPFVAVNCAALPDSLLESELFGYVEGAFTGARKGGKPGLFEMAHSGTIFLDEVSDMSSVVQSRFLRVLQEKQAMRVGGNRVYEVDVRIIAASNKNLLEEVEHGRFRRDLYYRLKVLDISVPSLRSRPEDIIPLFVSFMNQSAQKYSFGEPESIPQELVDAVLAYQWPGNIRELRNFAEKASVLLSLGDDRDEAANRLIRDLSTSSAGDDAADPEILETSYNGTRTLKEIESETVRKCWLVHNRNISETARVLGIDRSTVRRYVRKT
jgi:transcriptional regulator with PAS, ATPase and Fis domain